MTIEEYMKSWVDANMFDGEDRSEAQSDTLNFSAPDFYEMIGDLAEDLTERIAAGEVNA